MLRKYGVPLYEEKKVEHLLENIKYTNTEFNTEVNICRYSNSSILIKGYTYLPTVVARIYPSNNPSSDRFRNRGIYDSDRGDCISGQGEIFKIQGKGRGCGGIIGGGI